MSTQKNAAGLTFETLERRTLLNSPAAPTALLVTQHSSTAISLSWADPAGDQTGFRVDRQVGGGKWSPVAKLKPNTLSFTNKKLKAHTSYSYRVWAMSGSTLSAAPATLASDPITAPASLTRLRVVGSAPTSITLHWTNPIFQDVSARIEELENGQWVEVATVDSLPSTYEVDGLSPNSKYSFRVWATDGSTDSDHATVLTNAKTQTVKVPAAPVVTINSYDASSLTLSWTETSTNTYNYRIEQITNGVSTPLVTLQQYSYTISGLTPNTPYEYHVVANNDFLDSSPADVKVTTLANRPSGYLSNVIEKSATTSSITLSWTYSTTDQTGFKITRQFGSNPAVPIATIAGNITQFTDLNAPTGNDVFYSVVPVNSGGDGWYSPNIHAATLPVAPQNLQVTGTSPTSFKLQWSGTDGPGLTSRVELWNNGQWQKLTDGIPYSQTFTVTGLTPSTSYMARVWNSNFVGDSSQPAFLQNVTTAAAGNLPIPTNLAVSYTSSGTSAVVQFTDNATVEQNYLIEYRDSNNPGDVWTPAGIVEGSPATGPRLKVVAGLNIGVTYSFRVTAVDGIDQSEPQVATAPPKPTSSTTVTLPDGKVLTAAVTHVQISGNGWWDAVWSNSQTITRTNADGSADSTFANNGTLTIATTTGSYNSQLQIVGLIGRSDDSFIVVFPDASLTNYSKSGVKGNTLIPAIGSVYTLGSDNKLYVAGLTGATNTDLFVSRYNTDLTLDKPFGTKGTSQLSGYNAPDGIVLLPNGLVAVTIAGRAVAFDTSGVAQPKGFNGPIGLTASQLSGTKKVEVKFTDNTTSETGYVIQVSHSGGVFADIASLDAVTGSGGGVTFDLPDAFNSGDPLTFRVYAINGSLRSPGSQVAAVTIV